MTQSDPTPASTADQSAPPPAGQPTGEGAAPTPPATPAAATPLIVGFDDPLTPEQAKKRARSLLIIRLVAIALVVVIGLFWLQTWFGTKLTSDQLNDYLTVAAATTRRDDPEYNKATRNAQHALADLERRLEENEPGVEKFFPALVKVADHPEPAVRRTAAWVMGNAPGHPMLFDPLIKMMNDPDALVQQNAACSLSKFRDGEHSRPVLTAMLKPFALRVPIAGRIEQVVPKDTQLAEGRQVAVIAGGDGQQLSMAAPFKGRAYDIQAHAGDSVTAGQTLCLIQPNPEQVLAALTALSLVGRPEDLQLIRPYAEAGNGDLIRSRAQLALDAIAARAQAPRPNTGGANH